MHGKAIFFKKYKNRKFRIVTHWGERSQCDTEKKLTLFAPYQYMGLRFHQYLVFLLCFVIYIVVVYSLSHVRLFRNPMDCSSPDSSVHGIAQARILECFHFLLQGSFLTQGWNPLLLHWQVDSLWLIHQGSPYNLHAATAAKSLQSCPTPREPIDGIDIT